MSQRYWLVAVPVMAGAMIALTTGSAGAFTRETATPNGNYNFDYGPVDDKSKSDGANKSDSNSPGFHFSAGQSNGFHSSGSSGFNSSGSAGAPPSQPYFRTFGN